MLDVSVQKMVRFADLGFWTDSGRWEWALAWTPEPCNDELEEVHILDLILYEMQPKGGCEAVWIWVENNMKSFLIKSCYNILF